MNNPIRPEIEMLKSQEQFLDLKLLYLINKHSVCSNQTELHEIEKQLKDTEQRLFECRKHFQQLQWDETLQRRRNPSMEGQEV
jgi:hypothetical protein